MKIRGWSIDGFGLFHDWAVSALPDGLTVLHGANEAGKSTLLEFVRRVLFGLAPAGAAPPYGPSQGGFHRGRVMLANGDGDIVVERDLDRHAPPVLRRPDGRSVDAAELQHLLGGADERLFRSVFAFSLDDLRSLAGLDAGGVRDALFSAALAGAGRSARAAAQTLRAQAAARLDREGMARINQLIAELDALRPRLNAARRVALGYGEQRAAVERLAVALADQRAALAARRAARGRDDALLRAWPLWQALQAARAELAASEPVTAPPSGAEAQLRDAHEQLGSALGAVRALRVEQSEAERRASALPAAAAGDAAAAELEAQCADLPLHRAQVGALSNLRLRLAESEQRLIECLQGAGAEWSVERLRAWARVGIDRDSVRDWQARTRAAMEHAQQVQWRLDAAAAVRDAAHRERDRASAELPVRPTAPGATQPAVIEQGRDGLAALRTAIEEMMAHRRLGESTAQVLHERERVLRGLEADDDAPPPLWLARLLAAAGATSAVAVLWWLVRGSLRSAFAAAAVAVLAIVAERWTAQRERAHARREAQRQAQRRTLRSEMETARRGRDAAWHRAAQLTDQVARQATLLGLPRRPSSADLDARERAVADELAAAARAEEMWARLAELDVELRRREDDERACADEAAAAAAARQAIEAEWMAWSGAAGVAAAERPDAVLGRVALLEPAQAALAVVDTTQRELCHLEPLVGAWEGRARAALAGCGAHADDLGADALIERVVTVRLRLHEDALRRARRVALMDEIGDRAARLGAAEAEAERCAAAIEAALSSAGVRDETELARRRALADRRQALERAVAERARTLSERLGGEDALPELAEGLVDAWRQRAEQADGEIAALEQRLYQLVAEQHEAQATCRALEESADVATLETEWTALMVELNEAVREWRVLVAAEGLIDEACLVFERTRQPAVLRAASVAFAAVTGGRYERIAQDEGGQSLVVLERGGRRKQVGSELSRGTTEQLYLSLRLALAQELGRRGTALPLVMDDVLVNFDPDRARAMAEVLGAFAREQQVLFFTCHSATRDLLLQHGGAERLVEL